MVNLIGWPLVCLGVTNEIPNSMGVPHMLTHDGVAPSMSAVMNHHTAHSLQSISCTSPTSQVTQVNGTQQVNGQVTGQVSGAGQVAQQVNGHHQSHHTGTAGIPASVCPRGVQPHAHGGIPGIPRTKSGQCTPLSGNSPAQTPGPASIADSSPTMSSIIPSATATAETIQPFTDAAVVSVEGVQSVSNYNGHVTTPVPSPTQTLPVSSAQTEVFKIQTATSSSSFKRDPL